MNTADNMRKFGANTRFSSDNQPNKKAGPITKWLKEFGSATELTFTITKTDDKGNVSKSSATLSTDGETTINQSISVRLLQMALTGDIHAIKEILNRTEGRVPQPINLGGQEDNPVEVDDLSKLSTDELKRRRNALRSRIVDAATGDD